MSYLLDTNIVSLIIKRNPEISQKIEAVKAQKKSIFISCITYFEIKIGMFWIALKNVSIVDLYVVQENTLQTN